MKKEKKSSILKKITFLVGFTGVFIVLILAVVFFLFSRIDGFANAIDVSGSQRMRTILLGYYCASYVNAIQEGDRGKAEELKGRIQKEIETYERFKNGLINGDKELGLGKTKSDEILDLIASWEEEWRSFKAAISSIISPGTSLNQMKRYLGEVEVGRAVQLKDTIHRVVVAYTELSNLRANNIKMLLFVIICIVILATLIISVSIRANLKPVRNLVEVVHSIEEKDLTMRSKVASRDEIGQIGEALDKMLDTLDEFIRSMKEASRNVEHANEDLISSVEESGATVQEMVSSINNVHKSLERQNEVIEDTVKAVKHMAGLARNIKEHVEDQSSAIEESSASMEEMASSISAVSKNTESARHISEKLSSIAKGGGEKIKATVEAIKEIQQASSKIQTSVMGITKIAATTNLLSMNASIEAAHAGEAGRGFAVVAEEIGSLAADSAGEAGKIKQIVTETLEKIEKGTELSTEAGRAFNEIMEDIERTVEINTEIANAMQEQKAGIDEIVESIQHLVDLSIQIKKAVEEEDSGSNEMLNAIEKLKNLASEILHASMEQKAGGDEMLQALKNLRDLAERNNSTVEVLNSKIGQFKVS